MRNTYKATFALIILAILTLILSLVAIQARKMTYNAPIVPTCPIGVGSNLLGATDMDGAVSHAWITGRSIPGIRLGEVIPAAGPGDVLTANLNVFDITPPGEYRVHVTFANRDAPIPQTSTCRMAVTVIHAPTSDGGVMTLYSVQRADSIDDLPRVETIRLNQAGWGILPMLLAVVLAVLGFISFVTPFYRLEHAWEGFQFLDARLSEVAGDPGSGVGVRDVAVDEGSAIVLERPGAPLEVRRGPDTLSLTPIAHVVNTVALCSTGTFSVDATTRDGLPIRYSATVNLRIPPEDDAAILKAATNAWMGYQRQADKDNVRTLSYAERILTGEIPGEFHQRELCRYTLEELSAPEIRQQLRDKLRVMLEPAAQNFGAEIVDIPGDTVSLNGESVDAWIEAQAAKQEQRSQDAEAEAEAHYEAWKEIAYQEAMEELHERIYQELEQRLQGENQERDYTSAQLILSVIDTVRESRYDLTEEQAEALDALEGRLVDAAQT